MGNLILLSRSPAELPTRKRQLPEEDASREDVATAKRLERCPSARSSLSESSIHTQVDPKVRFLDVRRTPGPPRGISFN